MKSFECCGVSLSGYFLSAIILSTSATIFLVVSFSTSYWLESYQGTQSEFVRLGLWSVCFSQYRHPTIRYDHTFDGCHWIFSYKYHEIRSWLLPDWLTIVQVLMAFALVFALITVTIMIAMLVFSSLDSFRVLALAVGFVLSAISALTIFLAVSVFGSKCFDRAWIQYPNYNHLSWSYGLAVVSLMLEGCCSAVLLADAFHARRQVYRADVVYVAARQE